MLSLLKDQVDTELAKLKKGPYAVGKGMAHSCLTICKLNICLEAYVMHTLSLACSKNTDQLMGIKFAYRDVYDWVY